MSVLGIAAGVIGGIAVLGTAGSLYGARKLYNMTIPRQDVTRVAAKEVGDADKWVGYIDFIHKNKDYLSARESEHITIKARDGITLHADLYAADGEARTLVICSHGYTSTGWDSCSSIGAYFMRKGYDCLIVDNRAHGKSEGDYVGFGILDRYDILKWIEYINDRFESKKQLMLYGVSMGGATVLMTAGLELPENVRAVIADCAFTSPYDVFAHILKRDYHMAEFPVMHINNMMCRKSAGYGFSDYSTLEAVKTTKLPIMFVHGVQDTFVPTRMSHENFDACTAPKELLIVENAGHAASYFENPTLYEQKLEEFLTKHVPEIN